MTREGRDTTRPIRVCMLIPSYYPVVGGMETQVERLIPFLREQHVEASVVTRLLTDSPRHEVRDGVTIDRLPVVGGPGMRSISFTARGVAHAIRHRGDTDLFHAHSIMSPTTIAALAGLPLRRPRVVTLHATFEPERLLSKPLGGTRMRLYSRVIDRFVAISSDIETLLREHGVPQARIASIPNGIDVERFRPASPDERSELRRRLRLPEDAVLVLFAGRLHEVKQLDVLLRAWAAVPTGQLVIAGEGDERARLEALARDLDLQTRVSFLGMVENVDDYLRAADVFVLPSRSEGLSVALLEAMASGCVPVATAVGGAIDLIASGSNGLLVTPGDPEALSAALIHATEDACWRHEAAGRARETVAERYDLRMIARELAGLYRALTSSG